jgi:5'(3')-deoxyribonucleotidase
MSKQKFFIDFDLTIVDSIKAFCDVYNAWYKYLPEFKPADPNKISSYDFKCICPLLENKEDKLAIWSSSLFFDCVEFIDENTYDVLVNLNEKYQLIVCSIGTPKNIAQKAWFLKRKLPFIKDYVLLTNKDCEMNKSVVNMEEAIFLDDIPSNLESTNAETKVLFGKIYPWNKDWQGKYCLDWEDVGERFL